MSWTHRARPALVAATVLATLTLWAAPSSASSTTASETVPIWPTSRLACSGENAVGSPIIGTVHIRSDRDGPVVAEVSLKDGRPNTRYEFILLQTPGESGGCNKPADGILTTNSQGNGNVRLSAKRLPDTTGALVISVDPELLVSGHYVFGDK
jgi:hypothetical protein